MLSASFSAKSEAMLAEFRPLVRKRRELDGELGPQPEFQIRQDETIVCILNVYIDIMTSSLITKLE